MKIKQWSIGDHPDFRTSGMMVLVTQREAISIIKSLAHQISVNDCNNGREEFFDDDGIEFSIGVVDEDVLFRGEEISRLEDSDDLNNLTNLDDYDDDDGCIHCGLDPTTCGCWHEEDQCGKPGCWCNPHNEEGEYNEYGCLCNLEDDGDYCDMCAHRLFKCEKCDLLMCSCEVDELDQDNIANTFGPMNAFARTRWLKSQGRV